MAKGKTLRRAKKPQKKIYRGGQQQSLDYKDIQDVYASNLEKIKELHETIKKEGSQLYDVETSNRTDTVTVKGNTATTTLNVDRTKYDIKYGSGSFFSGLGDKTISDEFELKVNLAW